MNIIKLELGKKTIDEKIALGANHIASMTGNANYPAATRSPSDAAYQAIQDSLVASNAAVDAAETVWKSTLLARDNVVREWEAATTARASNCESVTPGNRAALATTGLPLRSLPTPVGVPDAPLDLLATPNKTQGQMNVKWSRVKGATSYIVQRMIHGSSDPWVQIKLLNQCRFTDTGLVSGITYAYRVRALAAAGEGPWSDETVRMAP